MCHMSEIRLHLDALPPTNEPLRIAVRRMRWFKVAFLRFVAATGQEMGISFEVDEVKLAAAFMRWLNAIETQKPTDKAERRDFFEFAAALMLRELMADLPIKSDGPPRLAAPDSAAAFWAEGYCCTTFCLSVHSAAMAQEYHTVTEIDPAIDDLRHWWSFKENSVQDASFSAGFLQMIIGNEPNWIMPDVFRLRIQNELLQK